MWKPGLCISKSWNFMIQRKGAISPVNTGTHLKRNSFMVPCVSVFTGFTVLDYRKFRCWYQILKLSGAYHFLETDLIFFPLVYLLSVTVGERRSALIIIIFPHGRNRKTTISERWYCCDVHLIRRSKMLGLSSIESLLLPVYKIVGIGIIIIIKDRKTRCR